MKKIQFLYLVAIMYCGICQSIYAQGRLPISYQGFLLDKGNPVTDTLDFQIQLYEKSNLNGSAIWTEDHYDVDVQNGIYSIQIGSVDPDKFGKLTFDEQYYLSVKVSGYQFTEKMPFLATPYSYYSQRSDSTMIAANAIMANTANTANKSTYADSAHKAFSTMNAEHSINADTSEYAKKTIYDAPIGSIVAFVGKDDVTNDEIESQGWMVCNGRALDRNVYKALYDRIGTTFGRPNDNAKFFIPDLRGMFLRGANRDLDNNVRTDSLSDLEADLRIKHRPELGSLGGNDQNNVGSVQMDAFQYHEHHQKFQPTSVASGPMGISSSTDYNATFPTGGIWNTANNPIRTSQKETRPKNVYVYWIIKVKN